MTQVLQTPTEKLGRFEIIHRGSYDNREDFCLLKNNCERINTVLRELYYIRKHPQISFVTEITEYDPPLTPFIKIHHFFYNILDSTVQISIPTFTSTSSFCVFNYSSQKCQETIKLLEQILSQ